MAFAACCAAGDERKEHEIWDDDNNEGQRNGLGQHGSKGTLPDEASQMLQLARMRLEAQRLFEEWKRADIEERRSADLLASGVCDNDAAITPGTKIGKTTVAEATLGRFTGAWEECSAEKGVHIITDTTLRWSSVATSDLVFCGNTMKMIYRGKEMSGSLDEAGEKLQWNDGDIWSRAGLHGWWKERSSGIIHRISGTTVSTLSDRGSERVENVKFLSETCFSITLTDGTHTATLDRIAMVLNWSDGDAWDRTQMRRGIHQLQCDQ